MPATVIRSDQTSARGADTPGFKVAGGELIFLSGQVPVDRQGTTVGIGDPAAQTRQALENVRALLRASGADLQHVIKLTIYNTDMAHRQAINAARRAICPAPLPASTHVQVARLVNPDWLVELDVVAFLPSE
jgi:enamine deaminase RidA (YjgF/YER057c/UK114 family)